MENSGRAVVGAFTGVMAANEWKKGRAAPVSGALRDFHSHPFSVAVLRRVDRRDELLEAHQVQHPPSWGRSPLRRGEGPFEIVGQPHIRFTRPASSAPKAFGVNLHSHRTFSRPLSKKCVYPNQRLTRLRQRLRRGESSRRDVRPRSSST